MKSPAQSSNQLTIDRIAGILGRKPFAEAQWEELMEKCFPDLN